MAITILKDVIALSNRSERDMLRDCHLFHSSYISSGCGYISSIILKISCRCANERN